MTLLIYIQAYAVRDHSLNLLGLPNEILIDICKSMSQDLPNVRLTCRRLCQASTQRFAVVNFTERVHVVTPHSIGALVNVTGHPLFGKHIKSVGFCSARRTAPVKGRRSVALNGYVTTGRFARDLEQVFTNIKHRAGSVTVAIYDNPGVGCLGAWSGCRLASRSCPTSIRCHGWQDLLEYSPSYITYRTAETFEQAVYAARRVRCRILGLKMDLSTGYNSLAQAQIQQAMEEILESSPAPLSVDLGRNEYPKLSYDSSSKSVELRDIVYDGPGMNAGFNIPVDALFAWLNSQIIVEAKVDYIDNFTTTRLQQTIFTSASSSQGYTLKQSTSIKPLERDHRNHLGVAWSEALQTRRPNLQYHFGLGRRSFAALYTSRPWNIYE
jgi:hypothetical protein